MGLLLSLGRVLVQSACAAYAQYSICLCCNTLRWVFAALAGRVVVSLQIDRAIAKQYHLWGAESRAIRVKDRYYNVYDTFIFCSPLLCKHCEKMAP